MNWKEIKVSSDAKSFILNGKKLFDKDFIEVLKFHDPGYASVRDNSGWYHINTDGASLYNERYKRAFGYYYNRAAVIDDIGAFHIDELGNELYKERYLWCGNYQEEICVVRKQNDSYTYINIKGEKLSDDSYMYAGDFKDGFACIKTIKGWTHISKEGLSLHNKYFLDLGIYHKGYATARDQKGWFHIDMKGNEIYQSRFIQVEPFYNGIALVHDSNWNCHLLDESGKLMELFK